MSYILIVVFLNGVGPRPEIRFQEFESESKCQAAVQEIKNLFEKSRDLRYINGASCLKK